MLSVISLSYVQKTLTEYLAKTKVTAKFMPPILTDHQKERQVESCRAFKTHLQIDHNFFLKL